MKTLVVTSLPLPALVASLASCDGYRGILEGSIQSGSGCLELASIKSMIMDEAQRAG